MIKAVHMTSVHPVTDARILYKECMGLAEAGYDVVLVCPNDRAETLSGVRISPVPKPRNRIDRLCRTVIRIYHAALAERAQIYHLHDPELLPLGLLLRLRGKCVVYDAHEDLPLQVLSKHWIPKALRTSAAMLARLLVAFAASVCSHVVAATPQVARRFGRKTTVVQNYPLRREIELLTGLPYGTRPRRAIYIGGLSKNRGVLEIVRAFAQVRAGLGVELVLAGSFIPPSLLAEAASVPGWERVQYVGWQPRPQVLQLLSESRLGLVLLHPSPNYLESYPVKLFEYMAAGIPVVASDFPLWRSIVAEAGCGVLVDPRDCRQIAEAIERLINSPAEAERMGLAGQAAVLDRYNWDVEFAKLSRLYASLANQSGLRSGA